MYYYAVHRPYGQDAASNRDIVHAFDNNDSRWLWVSEDSPRREGLDRDAAEVASAFQEGPIGVIERIGPRNWKWLRDIESDDE